MALFLSFRLLRNTGLELLNSYLTLTFQVSFAPFI